MNDFEEKLKKRYQGEIAFNEELAPYVTFRIGGRCKYLAFPSTEKELLVLISLAKNESLPYYIIGNGSNLLFGSKDFEGMVIYLSKNFNEVIQTQIDGDTLLKAAGGVTLWELGEIAAANSLGGLEYISYIPGTLGGALITNAEAHQVAIESLIEEVVYFNGESIRTFSREECLFSYRSSIFDKHPNWIILGALLRLKKMRKTTIEARRIEAKEFRMNKQPRKPSAGSIFKNPKVAPAGLLIDRAGLKGLKRGDAEVSTEHGNFIVNLGNASSGDVLWLIEEVRRRIFLEFSIILELEIKILNG